MMAGENSNRGGRPAVRATPVTVRLPPDQLASLHAWIATLPDPKPSRPEAIRQVLKTMMHIVAKDRV